MSPQLRSRFLSALILATRCANYQDVFVGGNIYFADADCYARMTRVKMCAENPGLIVRHHDFENFPQGTTPHTTALFDYLILALSWIIVAARPLVAPYHLDLAGALISPLLALFGGWFLWWWSRRMGFRYRWVMLILYAIQPDSCSRDRAWPPRSSIVVDPAGDDRDLRRVELANENSRPTFATRLRLASTAAATERIDGCGERSDMGTRDAGSRLTNCLFCSRL